MQNTLLEIIAIKARDDTFSKFYCLHFASNAIVVLMFIIHSTVYSPEHAQDDASVIHDSFGNYEMLVVTKNLNQLS